MTLCDLVTELRSYLARDAAIPPKPYAAIQLAAEIIDRVDAHSRTPERPWSDER